MALLVTVIWSCEDELPKVEDEQSLVGIWIVRSTDQSDCADPIDNEFVPLVCTDQTCITFEFKSDLSFEAISIDDGITEPVNGTYTVSGNLYTITADGETISGPFTLSGNNLTLFSVDADSGCAVEASLEKQ